MGTKLTYKNIVYNINILYYNDNIKYRFQKNHDIFLLKAEIKGRNSSMRNQKNCMQIYSVISRMYVNSPINAKIVLFGSITSFVYTDTQILRIYYIKDVKSINLLPNFFTKKIFI